MESMAGGDASKYSGGPPPNDPAWRVVIAVGHSRQALAWVVTVAASSVAAILAADLPAFVQATLAALLASAAVQAARRHAWRTAAGAIRGFTVGLPGRIVVEPARGPPAEGRVVDGSFVAPWLVVVRWRPDGARWTRSIFLLPDMAGEQELRRLRVLLRWGGF
jgi:hypothetical protein